MPDGRLGTRIVADGFAGVKCEMTFGAGSHIFEAAGLGKFPYTCEGEDIGSGRCQFCGASLKRRWWLNSADGKRFYVGGDCVVKHGGSAVIEIVERWKRETRRIAKNLGIPLSEARILELNHRREILAKLAREKAIQEEAWHRRVDLARRVIEGWGLRAS